MWRTLAATVMGVLCLSILVISSATSVVATSPRLVSHSYASDPTFPWVGVGVKLYPDGSVQYVSCSDYVYASHGWLADNWSSTPSAAQTAFLDPTQNNFTLATNASGFANPPLTQFTYYNSTEDTMTSWFWFQFHPGDLAPGAYSFTGTWQEAAAANYPNYTAVYAQNTITLVVNLSKSTVLVSCSPNSIAVGWPVNCTATVSGFNPSGTVAWSTSSVAGSFSQSVCTLSNGSCSTTYTDNFTGSVTIAASYSGDSNNGPSSGSMTLTVFINVTTGTNVTVTPTNNLELTFVSVTAAGIVVASETPTVPAPPLDLVGEYYDIKVTASFVGNVTVSLAFDGSNMTTQQKSSLRMMEYTPLIGDINHDGTVDILDAILLSNAFGVTPSSSSWNPRADINGDGVVNILDAIVLANHFGQTASWVNITLYVDTTSNIVYGQTTHFSYIGIH